MMASRVWDAIALLRSDELVDDGAAQRAISTIENAALHQI
jgi:hypothetical protein